MNEPFTKRNYPTMSKWYWEWLQEFETMQWTYVQENGHTIGQRDNEGENDAER